MRPGAIIGLLGIFFAALAVIIAIAIFTGKDDSSDAGNNNVTVLIPPDNGGSTRRTTGGVRIDFADDAPRIVLNAASGRMTGPVELIEDLGASSGLCAMTPHHEDDPNRGGRVEFVVDVESAGSYNLWLRVNWSHSCANSLWVEVDGERLGETITNNTFNHWQWMRYPGAIDLEAGKAALVIEMREDEAKFDQALLTQDLAYVPVGVQSAN